MPPKKKASGGTSQRGAKKTGKAPTGAAGLHEADNVVAALKLAAAAASNSSSLEEVRAALASTDLVDQIAAEIWRRKEVAAGSGEDPTPPPAAPVAEAKNDWWDETADDVHGKSWALAVASVEEERSIYLHEAFKSIDGNDDKTFDKTEFVAAMTAPEKLATFGEFSAEEAAALFDDMDNTKTGKMSLAKFDYYFVLKTITNVNDKFKQIDGDDDRQISYASPTAVLPRA